MTKQEVRRLYASEPLLLLQGRDKSKIFHLVDDEGELPLCGVDGLTGVVYSSLTTPSSWGGDPLAWGDSCPRCVDIALK